MRLFIAVLFDDKTKEHLLMVQSRLKMLGKGSFSRLENLHLTLAFLGEVAREEVAAVRRAMDQTTIPVLRLTFDHVGHFPREEGDIWWIGLAPNEALSTLQNELSKRLRDKGFRLESRSFIPHITLARRVVLKTHPEKNELLGVPFSASADTISLMLSERVNGQLIYTQQYAVHAQKQAKQDSC